ncbi:hypothetical protein DUI87_05630 [Hirundo rustica rustica]|uniref:peptide-methionine (S)-S-oxide reductase n=1 Tax=Hirundo rustica rustica TaxID=333673 RepID=A0A3M0LD60_HIRRU|nr:hypothetical protein DUI87_05630 [Hirundo rustica rustica]
MILSASHCPNLASGRTGHTEAVRVVFEPQNISFEQLLKVFWENHDPTQGIGHHQRVASVFQPGEENLQGNITEAFQYLQGAYRRDGEEYL